MHSPTSPDPHHQPQGVLHPPIDPELDVQGSPDSQDQLTSQMNRLHVASTPAGLDNADQQRIASESVEMHDGVHLPQAAQRTLGQAGAPMQRVQVVGRMKPMIDEHKVKPFVGLDPGRRPTEAELQQARLYKDLLLKQLIRPGIDNMIPQHVPLEYQAEYARKFDELLGYTHQVVPVLELFICAYNDYIVKKLIAAGMTVLSQKALSDTKGSPCYLIRFQDLRNITSTMKAASEGIPYKRMWGGQPSSQPHR